MTPKTLLACLTDADGAPALCAAAATLAEHWDAHLVGLHVMEGVVFYPPYPVGIPGTVYQAIRTEQTAHAGQIEAAFRAATKGLDARCEWRLLSSDNDLPADRAVESARAADLVMMNAVEAGTVNTYQQRFLQEAVIRGSGRPVLIVPAAGEIRVPRRAVVGWRDTAQATRAVHDLIPLLSGGGAVRIVAFDMGARLGETGDQLTDLAASLARHGLEVEIARRTDVVDSISGALQAEAREFGADLLAVGAYGHSALYDLILGAVSRELLRETAIPVLFSR
jgi:nucleotide-binding universal stress UspA family protein